MTASDCCVDSERVSVRLNFGVNHVPYIKFSLTSILVCNFFDSSLGLGKVFFQLCDHVLFLLQKVSSTGIRTRNHDFRDLWWWVSIESFKRCTRQGGVETCVIPPLC
jgi:hypothetical protein